MKKRIALYVIAFLALLSGAVTAWLRFSHVTIEEPRNIAFNEHNLDIKEIKIPSIDEPIWFVKTKNPTVAVLVCFKNEGARSFNDKPGLLPLVSSLLSQGAGPYNATELAQIWDANRIEISANFNSDDWSVSLYCVPEKFQLAMDLFREGALNAHLPEEKIEMFKREMKENIHQNRVYPESIAGEAMMKLMYTPDHPYFVTDGDVLSNIDKYTRNDLVKAYNKLFDPRDAYVIVAGNISEDEVKETFEKLFISLKKQNPNTFKSVEQDTKLFKEGEIIHLKYDAPQTIIAFRHPGIKRNAPERFAFIMANEILGRGVKSRLFTELREKLGLVYAVDSSTVMLDMISVVAGSTATEPKNRDVLISKIKEIFQSLAEKGVTQEELDFHKVSLAVSEDLSSASNIVSFLNLCKRMNIPFSKVNRYSHNFYDLALEEVNSVIKKSFDPNKLNFVTIGAA
ncbi:MAG: insulinase family protein [Holosporales bacterium]|jgi:zinc protease|nr:insulinase family protein [Holosporales bacterium]